MKEETTVIAVTNDYPTDKYNLLIPVKSMQELSSMYRIVVNEVQINNDDKAGDVYLQTKGYGNSEDKLALTKTALSKLMNAAGIQMVSSKPLIPSTHQTAIEMAKAIGKAVEYDTRDVAHEVILLVPEASGQFRQITAIKEIIIDDLKAEYIEQKRNLEIWVDKKKRQATEEEKNAAVEKQLTQFLSHKRGQCETKALNRALREAMGIKPTYTKAELQKPFIVAHVVPNMDAPELKNAMIDQYKASTSLLFGQAVPLKEIASPTVSSEIAEKTPKEETTVIEAEIVGEEPGIGCEKCGIVIEDIDDQWTTEAIVEYSKNKFKGKIYCADCQKEVLEAFRRSKEAAKNEK